MESENLSELGSSTSSAVCDLSIDLPACFDQASLSCAAVKLSNCSPVKSTSVPSSSVKISSYKESLSPSKKRKLKLTFEDKLNELEKQKIVKKIFKYKFVLDFN